MESSTKTEIIEFLNAYSQAFENLNAEEISSFWYPPTFAIDSNGLKLCSNQNEILDAFLKVVDEFKKIHFWQARYELGQIRVLRDDLLDFTIKWILVNQDNELIKFLNNVYVLRRLENSWKITAVYLKD